MDNFPMTSINIQTQAVVAISVGIIAWIIGAAVWEWASVNWERWLGRAVVGAGVLQLAAFSHYASRQVERLNFLVDIQGQKAYDGRDPKAAEYTGQNGRKFRIEFGTSGRPGTGIGYTTTLLPAMGRAGGSGERCGCCDRACGGSDASLHGMYCERPESGLASSSTSARRRVCECNGIESCDCIDCECAACITVLSARAN
jgi:hypothetical protein